ncbi:MAG TPA: hypothetical protein VF247_07970 [Candidatus Krumholzibacteria bacterium]
MNRIVMLLLAAGVLVAAPLLAAAPPLNEKVAVRATFGAAPEQFGRANIGAATKTTRLVNCFSADGNHIAVHDRVKRDVKIFSATGVFDKAIRLRLTGAKPDTVRARDVALAGDNLYVLVDDQKDGSKTMPASMRLGVFDIATGTCRDVRSLDTSVLAGGQPTARGADAYLLHPDGAKLWFVDSINQMSFEITGAQLAKRPVFGWGSQHRVRTDDNAMTINLLDSTGKILRRMPGSGVLVAVSDDGSNFAVMQTAGGSDWKIVIFDANGDAIGAAPRPNRAWKPFKPPVMERKYELVESPAGPELYEMYANSEGVRIVRWGK